MTARGELDASQRAHPSLAFVCWFVCVCLCLFVCLLPRLGQPFPQPPPPAARLQQPKGESRQGWSLPAAGSKPEAGEPLTAASGLPLPRGHPRPKGEPTTCGDPWRNPRPGGPPPSRETEGSDQRVDGLLSPLKAF